jgi:hypothetical protein
MVRVHEFSDGGCEIYMRRVWKEKNINRAFWPGPRDPDRAPAVENRARSSQRARGMVRRRIRELRLDHLLTLTYRENVTDIERLKSDWKKLYTKVRKSYPEWQFVAVPETQTRGAWHLHVAVKGWQDVRLIRQAWWDIVGVGMGNIHVRAPKYRWRDEFARQSTNWTSRKLAAYLSKYVSKTFDALALGGRRYWASAMPELTVHRLVIHGGDFAFAYKTVIDFIVGPERAYDLQQWHDKPGDVFWLSSPGPR